MRRVDADTRRRSRCDETTTARSPRGGRGGVRRRRRLGRRPRRTSIPTALARTLGVHHPPGVPRASLGDVDAPVPAAPRDRDIALDRIDDPARLLHDEAERDDRDGSRSAGPSSPSIHPFAPARAGAAATVTLIPDLEAWLCEITGYDAVSLQPNAGSQGELAGLLAIRGTTAAAATHDRTVCLIPSSRARHERRERGDGRHATSSSWRATTTATSTSTTCAPRSSEHGRGSAALMITYPSTHGVFEDAITEICDLVHEAGGQVYLDGANLNAMVGLAQPGQVRRRRVPPEPAQDVLHPPRRRGARRRADRRARPPRAVPARPPVCVPEAGPGTGVGPIAAAPWGSARILRSRGPTCG